MKAYIDGSSVGYYGYLITEPKEKRRLVKDYPLTNNQAEWLALLTLLMDLDPGTEILVYSDSQIVTNQLTGEWETKNQTLKHLRQMSLEIIKAKKLKIKIDWISRNNNLFGKYLDKLMRKERKKRKKLRENLKKGYR